MLQSVGSQRVRHDLVTYSKNNARESPSVWAPLLHMPATSRSLQAPHTYRFRSSHNSLRFNNLLEQLTELEKALYLLLQFYHKGYKSEPTKWNRHTVGGLGGFLMRSFLASPHEVRGLTLPAYLWVHQPGSSSEPQHPELLLEFHYKGWVD